MHPPHGPAIQYWIINGDSPSLIGPMEGLDLWYFIATRIDQAPEDVDPKELIQRATGMKFEMEILGTSPWVAHSLIADKYSEGRIFHARRRVPPASAVRRLRHEHGDRRRRGPGLEACRGAPGLGGTAAAGKLRNRNAVPCNQWVIEEAFANYSALGNHLSLPPGLRRPARWGDATRREAGDVIFAAKLREFQDAGRGARLPVSGFRGDCAGWQ